MVVMSEVLRNIYTRSKLFYCKDWMVIVELNDIIDSTENNVRHSTIIKCLIFEL